MTVKELHTLSDTELIIVMDALKIARAHYDGLVETVKQPDFQRQFAQQAEDASTLLLKIEAAQ